MKLLKQIFFLKLLKADLSNMKEYNYLNSLKTLIITESKVKRAVKNVNLNKTSESNEILLLTLH